MLGPWRPLKRDIAQLVDDDADPGCRYTIETDSDSSGGETLLATDDPDEVEAWIQTRIDSPA